MRHLICFLVKSLPWLPDRKCFDLHQNFPCENDCHMPTLHWMSGTTHMISISINIHAWSKCEKNLADCSIYESQAIANSSSVTINFPSSYKIFNSTSQPFDGAFSRHFLQIQRERHTSISPSPLPSILPSFSSFFFIYFDPLLHLCIIIKTKGIHLDL